MNIFIKIFRWFFPKKKRKHEENDFKVLQLVAKVEPDEIPNAVPEIIEPEPVRQKFDTTPNPNKYWRRFKGKHGGKIYWKKFYYE